MHDSRPENLRERTARVAKQTIRQGGFDVDTIRGAISIMCAMNFMVGGPGGMSILAEKLSSSVGYAPTLGLCVGPEVGQAGDSKCSPANFTYSAVVFSSKRVKNTLTPGATRKTFRTRGGTMMLSASGEYMSAEKD